MESTSGETYNPHQSMSSPVLTMIVSSSEATICRSPSTNFAPPVPPVRTVIIPASPPEQSLQRPHPNSSVRKVNRWPPPAERTPDKPAASGATEILLLRCAAAVLPDAARAFLD